MNGSLDERCRGLVAELGLGSRADVRSVRPLTGGVASDIALVDLGDKSICIKFALSKLKVAADWRAPVHRNAAEYAWLKFAADVAPECAVRVLGHSEERHGFAMEYVSGGGVYLWKAALLSEAPDQGEARAVGNLLGRLHAASASAGFDRNGFENVGDFHALRIEPYLNYTAKGHPALTAPMTRMAEALHSRQAVLIHGDASPKNVLIRTGNPILIDAECATMGDPSFDLAFCMNHLLLKAVHLHGARARYLAGVLEFWEAYAPHITWEPAAEIEARTCALLPMLFLARVDGKSPVEYLSEPERELVRSLAQPLIKAPTGSLPALVEFLNAELREAAA